MKILLNIMQYDYGDKTRGYSFEYDSFYDSLVKMGHQVDIFDFLTLCQTSGRREMNQRLLSLVKKRKYDLVLTSLYTDEFSSDFLKELKRYCTNSIVWMNDDQWRWENLGKKVCFSFHHVITTDPDAVKKYHDIGYKNVILSQFACNINLFKKLSLKKDIDVSFVGQPNPWRRFVIEYLRKNGINVQCYGFGWPNGRLTVAGIVDIFNRSKINLNLSNSIKFDWQYLTSINLGWDRKISIIRNLYSIFGPQLNTLLSPKRSEQIKARIFEITGSGGFMMTYDVKHQDRYFNPDQDFVTYSNLGDLLNKTNYYLKHNVERERIADIGYKKTISKHTYEQRFKDILLQIKNK